MAGGNYEKLMYNQYAELVEKFESLQAEFRQASFEQKLVIERLNNQHKDEIAELKADYEQEIDKRDKEIADLKAANEKLSAEVDRLKSIINNNSRNSSNPPSSDQKPSKKVNEHNLRKKTTRHKGAQPKHKGTTLSKKDVDKMLKSGQCKHIIKNIGKRSGNYVSRYVVDIKIVPVVTEYRIYQNKNGRYVIPNHLNSEVTYGSMVRSMTVALYSIGVMANNRIAEFLNNITNNIFHIAAGSIYRFCRSFSSRCHSDIEKIQTSILNERVCHTDATYITLDGRQSYVRNFSTTKAVLYAPQEKKNLEELGKIPLLKRFTGIFVHDHETAMYHFGLTHAECNVHLLRYLRKNSEDTGNTWSDEMSELLQTMNCKRNEHVTLGKSAFSEYDIAKFEQEYVTLLEKGKEQNKQTQSKFAKQEEKTLLNRLGAYQENHLLFIHDFDVPFSNNMSERDLRKCKNRQKISGGFRNDGGVKMYCDIMTIVETAKKNQEVPFFKIKEIIESPAE